MIQCLHSNHPSSSGVLDSRASQGWLHPQPGVLLWVDPPWGQQRSPSIHLISQSRLSTLCALAYASDTQPRPGRWLLWEHRCVHPHPLLFLCLPTGKLATIHWTFVHSRYFAHHSEKNAWVYWAQMFLWEARVNMIITDMHDCRLSLVQWTPTAGWREGAWEATQLQLCMDLYSNKKKKRNCTREKQNKNTKNQTKETQSGNPTSFKESQKISPRKRHFRRSSKDEEK